MRLKSFTNANTQFYTLKYEYTKSTNRNPNKDFTNKHANMEVVQ